MLEFLLDRAKLLDVQSKMLAANDYKAFREAINEGNIEVLEMLLNRAELSKELHTILTVNNHEIFRVAADNGNIKTL